MPVPFNRIFLDNWILACAQMHLHKWTDKAYTPFWLQLLIPTKISLTICSLNHWYFDTHLWILIKYIHSFYLERSNSLYQNQCVSISHTWRTSNRQGSKGLSKKDLISGCISFLYEPLSVCSFLICYRNGFLKGCLHKVAVKRKSGDIA